MILFCSWPSHSLIRSRSHAYDAVWQRTQMHSVNDYLTLSRMNWPREIQTTLGQQCDLNESKRFSASQNTHSLIHTLTQTRKSKPIGNGKITRRPHTNVNDNFIQLGHSPGLPMSSCAHCGHRCGWQCYWCWLIVYSCYASYMSGSILKRHQGLVVACSCTPLRQSLHTTWECILFCEWTRMIGTTVMLPKLRLIISLLI